MSKIGDSSFGKKIVKTDGMDNKTGYTTTLSTPGHSASIPSTAATTSTKASTVSGSTSTAAASAPGSKKGYSTKDIERRAYEIWVRKGKPQGRDLENWAQAERELGLK